ncbi:MAG: hypothetical protein LBD56_00595 [Endomicrobium sp.]|nr:hypothetical protein [Endomicrobium sp.]
MNNLKIGYTSYIEVSKSNLTLIPKHYVCK